MLPIVLVLLVATSALAAPSVTLHQYGINEIQPPKHNGNLVSAYVTDRAFSIVDGGDTTPYVLTAQQIVNDLANRADGQSQALALGQTLAILSQLAVGVPGDACAATNVIDAFVSGNPSSIRHAVKNFGASLAGSIDIIVDLATNPDSTRYAVGSSGSCASGGRQYPFEGAWDAILSTSGSELLQEQYCAAKRLFGSVNVRSNNIGAYLTAVSLPPVQQVLEKMVEPLGNFVAALGSGNPAQFVGAAKHALLNHA